MEQLNTVFVLLAGLNFLEHVRALPVRIWEVVTHGVHHRAMSALATVHLCSDMDLRAVVPWFPPELPVQRASYDFFLIGFGSFKILVSYPFQSSHKFLSFFCPFLRIPFCSVGGPRTDGEICPAEI